MRFIVFAHVFFSGEPTSCCEESRNRQTISIADRTTMVAPRSPQSLDLEQGCYRYRRPSMRLYHDVKPASNRSTAKNAPRPEVGEQVQVAPCPCPSTRSRQSSFVSPPLLLPWPGHYTMQPVLQILSKHGSTAFGYHSAGHSRSSPRQTSPHHGDAPGHHHRPLPL